MAKVRDRSKMSKAWRMATLKRSIPIYLMALPGLIYLFINNYMPMPGIILAFKNYKAKEIVDYMHEEKAYIETKPGEIIPFSLAKEIRDL